jgi:hypothetical protein
MRKLLVALAIIPVMAHAEALFETANKGGGKIVLTDEICSDGKNRMAYATHPEVETSMGCWAADRSNIHIKWDGGQLRSYDYSGWRDLRRGKSNT